MMMKMKTYFAGATALALVGCASVPVEQRLVDACDHYAGVLDALAVHAGLGTLTDAQIAQIDDMNLVVFPLCMGELGELTLDGALDTVERALEQLIIARRQAGEG